MRLRQRSSFSFVRTEGAILPADLLSRIQEGDITLGGLSPEDYHLLAGERLNEAISRSWNRLLGAWASFQSAYANLPAGDPAVGVTREKLLLPLFDELHYGRLSPTKALEVNGKSYPVSHGWRSVPIHLVGYGIRLDQRTAGVAGAARYSPHGMMQEFLSRSDDHLWGFVSNGVVLRILRDNASLTRQAFVEFNLESIFDGETYANFALLWLLCHQSRVEAERPDQYWLERWSQTAQTEGARALDRLRDGVEKAIRSLGRGFLAYPSNQALRERLRKGDLSSQDYYRQLLRLVYRLIFLFAAEDRNLLFPPEASTEERERYGRFYSSSRLRSLAAHRRGTAHPDLFRGLLLVMRKLGDPDGCPELGLPALGSFLWSGEAMGDLETCQIANHALLVAIRHLASREDSGSRRPVDYKNLGAEELGSVYEALLELNSEINLEGKTFELKVVGGSERKTTGSYYTPSSLIQQLLDTALDPVMEKALSKQTPEEALLGLKVCDPACGSGHFLVAAAHRIARRLASLRTGDEEPSLDAQRHALRDVIRHCIHGVDINPLAVELCKVNLWLEALEPGKPLSFLDHKIQCGNSLLGATPAPLAQGIPDEAFEPIEGDDKKFAASLRRQNRKERPKAELEAQGIASAQTTMFDRLVAEQRGAYSVVASEVEEVERIGDNTVQQVRLKEERFRGLVAGDSYRRAKLVADAWCAAFVWCKTPDAPPPVTDGLFRRLRRAPETVPAATIEEIDRLASQFGFFHWHLAFPMVFLLGEVRGPDNNQTGWGGGFDVVLGNPPWDQIQVDDREFFAGSASEIADAPTTSLRKRKIQDIAKEDPDLYAAFLQAKRVNDGIKAFVHNSDLFPLASYGRLNSAPLFVELARNLVSKSGHAGLIVPTGLATDAFNQFIFQALTDSYTLTSLYDFENRKGLFPAVHRSYKFCLLTFTGSDLSQPQGIDCVFYAEDASDLKDAARHFSLQAGDIALVNPNTRTCPVFPSKRDAEIAKSVYRRIPVLVAQQDGISSIPLGMRGILMFMMNTDSHLFATQEQLEGKGFVLEGNVFIGRDQRWLPLYEGKMVFQYDHRFADFRSHPPGSKSVQLPAVSIASKGNAGYTNLPGFWVSESEVRNRLRGVWDREWFVAWRDIANRTNERTVVGTALPLVAVANNLPLAACLAYPELSLCFLACLNSCVLDYVARLKVGGMHLNFYIVEQLPVVTPKRLLEPSPWDSRLTTSAWVNQRVLELVYVSKDMAPLATDYGLRGAPFVWNDARRQTLRHELDAAFFHLYLPATVDGVWRPARVPDGAVRDETAEELGGLIRHFPTPRDAAAYIMDTFPIARRKEEERHGEYRSKRAILEIYDEMQKAISTGTPYQTRLDPPPADPRVAHPAMGAS